MNDIEFDLFIDELQQFSDEMAAKAAKSQQASGGPMAKALPQPAEPKTESPEDVGAIIDRGIGLLAKAVREGKMSPQLFHEIDLRARNAKRHQNPVSLGVMAKSILDEVRAGSIGLGEAQGFGRMLLGPEAQLGPPDSWFRCWDRPAPAR